MSDARKAEIRGAKADGARLRIEATIAPRARVVTGDGSASNTVFGVPVGAIVLALAGVVALVLVVRSRRRS